MLTSEYRRKQLSINSGIMAKNAMYIQSAWLLTVLLVVVVIGKYASSATLEQQIIVSMIGGAGSVAIFVWSKLKGFGQWVLGFHIVLFWVAYLAQYPLYIILTKGRARELIIQSFLSPWARDISEDMLSKALLIILAAFIGVAMAGLLIKKSGSNRIMEDIRSRRMYMGAVPKRVFLAGAALFAVTSIPRYALSLHNQAVAADLPFNLNGIINLLNSQTAPYVMLAGISLYVMSGEYGRARKYAFALFFIGIVQFALFWSKLSIFGPIMFVLAAGWMFKARLLPIKKLALIAVLILSVYPLLNVYRSVQAHDQSQMSGMSTYIEGWKSEQNDFTGESDVLVSGLFMLWSRFVGLEPLLVVLDNEGNDTRSPLTVLLSDFDVDGYLTFDVMGYEGGMGYDAGFLGRLFFTFNSFTAVALVVALWIAGTAYLLSHVGYRRDDVAVALLPAVYIKLILISVSGPRVNDLTWTAFSLVSAWLICRMFTQKRRFAHEASFMPHVADRAYTFKAPGRYL